MNQVCHLMHTKQTFGNLILNKLPAIRPAIRGLPQHDNALYWVDMMTQAPYHRSNHRSNRRSWHTPDGAAELINCASCTTYGQLFTQLRWQVKWVWLAMSNVRFCSCRIKKQNYNILLHLVEEKFVLERFLHVAVLAASTCCGPVYPSCH
jgi:hypothetical protein